MSAAAVGASGLAEGGTRFRVWAPAVDQVRLRLIEPAERTVPLEREGNGYHQVVVGDVRPGARYEYVLDGGNERPDPASRLQPRGVHGPSEVVDPAFSWTDQAWVGPARRDYIFYELHVGTFTAEGTFDAVIPHLDALVELGITAIELMPVAQFPGDRNWGYDGVFPYAVQVSYGGPAGLRRLVDACHARGLAVVLDVVYNHLGPEGNVLGEYGPYFTDRYATAWGPALNFDGDGSDGVRHFFIKNALEWITDFHVDALRLDAAQAILDTSAYPFLEELAATVDERAERLGRRVYLFPEIDTNDPRVTRPRGQGGLGLDAQWNDDFHHALHALLTGERRGYYEDFFGRPTDLAAALRDGFAFTGQYSRYRGRRHGRSSRGMPAGRLIVYSQNHDQVGNRLDSERLSGLVSFEEQKLAAATVLFSPYLPLLFMGEEYGETAPFPYFISHSDPGLVEAVRRGRREEFAAFDWAGEPPDPQAEETFHSAKLDFSSRERGRHRVLLDFYSRLIRLRKELPALARSDKERLRVEGDEGQGTILVLHSADRAVQSARRGVSGAAVVLHFGDEPVTLEPSLPAGDWRTRLDSAADEWDGPGSALPGAVASDGRASLRLAPHSAVLLEGPFT